MVRLTDRPDMTLDVYRGRKTTIQQLNSRSDENLVCNRAYRDQDILVTWSINK